MLTRSASDLLGDARLEHAAFPEQPPPLFSASEARRRAEQDAILLHNRLRLLRAEDDKAKRKIRETEKRTQELIEMRRRNEDRRFAKEVDEVRREVETQEARARQQKQREEQQKKMLANQRMIQDQKTAMSKMVKQEREENLQFIRQEQQEIAAEAAAKAERVRREQAASERRRARSEGARLEAARGGFQEKLLREEDERRAKLQLIGKMEQEEADLLNKLQKSQERHRAAFAQLEDVIRQGSSSTCTPAGSRCPSSLEERPPLDQAFSSSGFNQPCARPPRPRAAPNATTPMSQLSHSASSSAPSRSRPGSARRSSAPPPRVPSRPPVPLAAASGCTSSSSLGGRCSADTSAPAASASSAAPLAGKKRDHSATSICSTASGPCTDSGRGSTDVSGHSTPSSAAAQLTYTTVDGTQLEIPVEEDLDLDQLLNGDA